jgi:phenylalanyl-tRNA synthetase alpha chain
LSRKGGLVSTLLKGLGSAPPAARPRLGQLVNALKRQIEAELEARLAAAAQDRPPKGAVDVTLPGRVVAVGHRHPLTLLREEIESIFMRMGFLVIEGPELEDDYHNFEALNIPRATCRTRCISRRRFGRLSAPTPLSCVRIPPACRSATWRHTRRPCG